MFYVWFGIFLLVGVTHASAHSMQLTSHEMSLLMRTNTCHVLLTESMPENLTYSTCSPIHMSTYSAWLYLMHKAVNNISIASFYWSLLADREFNMSSSLQGSNIFHMLEAKSKSLQVQIAQSGAQHSDPELDRLIDLGATVYWVDVAKMLGQGILHTKLWTVDGLHAYLGSANMDWRSLTQVKELGVTLLNCPLLVSDLDKIQAAYRLVSKGIPSEWPTELHTEYNATNPARLSINGIPSRVYFTNSPPQFNPPGRSNDLDVILSIINEAEKFVYISVMTYSPEILNYGNWSATTFWPVIDDALRKVALDRKVEVRLLISKWRHTSQSTFNYLNSLKSVNGVRGSTLRVRLFEVPTVTDYQKKIPFARVNHNKYMVTDKACYIGTSNWSGDYFLYSGGTAFVYAEDAMNSQGSTVARHHGHSIRKQTVEIFQRDWNSEYAFEL